MKLFSEQIVAYDEAFHPGTNIIRSVKNSCGKSTLMECIYFLLGGDIAEWNEAAKRLDFGLLEVLINGKSYTLKREIGSPGNAPIYLCETPLEEAEKSMSGWIKLGHRRTDQLKSFSQAIFDLLGYPEQKTSNDQNVTFNQVLRLLYCDQETSVNKIYKDVDFDREAMRQSIIELLLGVDDFALHSKRLALAEKQKALSEVRGSISSLSDTLRQVYRIEDFDGNLLDLQSRALEEEIAKIEGEISSILSNDQATKRKNKTKEVSDLEKKIVTHKEEISDLREQLAGTVFEIEDSTAFIESVNERCVALDAAVVIKDFFGTLDFKFCPVCLSVVSSAADASRCGLCKADIDAGARQFNRLKAKNEIEFQLKESRELLAERQSRKIQIEDSLERLQTALKKLEREYKAYVELPNYVDSEIRSKLNRVGYIERKLEDLLKNKQLGKLLNSKIAEKGALASEISQIQTEIELLVKDREAKWSAGLAFIGESIKELLKKDNGAEEAYKVAKYVEIQFDKDKMLVDGNSKFSASSEVVLKNSLFLSLFKFSTKNADARFPRILLLDNIEDKGMIDDRSHNFQKMIVSLVEESKVECQVIFTTSMIDPSLDNPTYCVGPKYAENTKTLKLKK